MKPLDIRDIAIIDAFPVYDCEKTVLNVGCGEGRIDYHLAKMGYFVYATDIKKHDSWQDKECLRFFLADIFKLTSFSGTNDVSYRTLVPVVICSQVLEHLKGYKKALANLIDLTEIRLIITVPYKRSFNSRSHVNYWDDDTVQEFHKLCKPYSVAISKILTKSEDTKKGHRNYLIIIDKRQEYAYLG